MSNLYVGLILLSITLNGATLVCGQWSRLPVYPIGMAEVVAIDTLPGGTVAFVDLIGRVGKVENNAVTEVQYPYHESSVRSVTRATDGHLVLYYDGTLMSCERFDLQFNRVASFVADVACTLDGEVLLLYNDGRITNLSDQNLNLIGVTDQVVDIYTRWSDTLFTVSIQGELTRWVKTGQSDDWSADVSIQLDDFQRYRNSVVAITTDSLLLLSKGGACRWLSVADETYSNWLTIDELMGKPNESGRYVNSIVISQNTIVASHQSLNSDDTYGKTVSVLYSFRNATWTEVPMARWLLYGLPSSVFDYDTTIIVGTKTGNLYSLSSSTFTALVRNVGWDDRAIWRASSAGTRKVVFLHKDTEASKPVPTTRYSVAVFDISELTWLAVQHIEMPSSWPVSNLSDLISLHKTEQTAFIVHLNSIASVDISKGKVIATQRVGQRGIVGMRLIDNGSLVVVNGAGRVYVLDTNLAIIDSSSIVTTGHNIASKAAISRGGDVILTHPSNVFSFYNSTAKEWTLIERYQGSETYPVFSKTAGEIIMVGDSKGGFIETMSLNGLVQQSAYNLDTASASMTFFASGDINSTVVVRASSTKPAIKVYQSPTLRVLVDSAQRSWDGTHGELVWLANCLVNQLSDSTFLLAYRSSEMFLCELNQKTSAVIDEPPPMIWIFSVYPNPCRDRLSVDINILQHAVHDSITIRILDLQGRVVTTTTMSTSGMQGRSSIEVDVSGINTGVYLLTASFAGFTHSIKLLVN